MSLLKRTTKSLIVQTGCPEAEIIFFFSFLLFFYKSSVDLKFDNCHFCIKLYSIFVKFKIKKSKTYIICMRLIDVWKGNFITI